MAKSKSAGVAGISEPPIEALWDQELDQAPATSADFAQPDLIIDTKYLEKM